MVGKEIRWFVPLELSEKQYNELAVLGQTTSFNVKFGSYYTVSCGDYPKVKAKCHAHNLIHKVEE